MSQNISWTATVNAAGAIDPLKQLQEQFGATNSAAAQSAGGFSSFSSAANTSATAARSTQSAVTPLGSAMTATSTASTGLGNSMSPLTGALGGAGTAARNTVGSMAPLGSAMKETATGGLTLNNTLQPMPGLMTSTSGSGQKWTSSLKENALGLSLVASTAVGLVSGLTSLESAHVALERAQLRQNTAALAVDKAQDTLNKDIVKYGPNSRKVAEDETNLANKRQALGIASERAGLLQTKYNEQLAEFATSVAPSLITMAGSMISVFGGMGSAATGAAAAEDVAGAATMGLGMKFALIAGPIAAVLVLFALIETNTFGMGDAFRATVDVIAKAIDTMISALNNLPNAVIAIGDAIRAGFSNLWTDIVAFFLNNLVNPIIRAWNTMEQGILSAIDGMKGAIMGAWGAVLTPMVDALLGALKKMNEGFAATHFIPQVDVKPLQALDDALHNTNTTATSTGSNLQKAFPPIKEIPVTTQHMNEQGAAAKQLLTTYGTFDPVTGQVIGGQKQLGNAYVDGAASAVKYNSDISGLSKTLHPVLSGATDMVSKLMGGLTGQQNAAAAGNEKLAGSANNAAAATTKQTSELQKLTTEITTNNNAMGTGQFQADAYATGILNVAKEIQDAVKNTNQYRAEANALNTALGYGATQAAFYGEGFAKAQKDVTEWGKANREAAGEVDGTIQKMGEARTQLDLLSAGFVKGEQDAVNWVQEQTKATESANGFLAALQKLDPQLSTQIPNAAKLTTDQLKLMYGVLHNFPDAIKEVNDWFNKMVDAVGNKLADAADKGPKELNKAIKDLEKELGGFKLPKDQVWHLKAEANFDDFINKKVPDFIGLLGNLLRSGVSKIDLQADATKIGDNLIAGLKSTTPGLAAVAGTIVQDIKNVFQFDPGTPKWNQALVTLKTDLENAHVPADKINTIMAAAGGTMSQFGSAVGGTISPLNDFAGAVRQAGDFGGMWRLILQGIAAQFNTQFKTAVNDAAGYINMLNEQIHAFVTNALVNSLQKGVQNASVAVNDAFRSMESNISGYTGSMTSTIQSFVRTAFIDSLELGATNAQRTVATAFNAMVTSVRSSTNQMIAMIGGLINIIKSVPTTWHTNFTASDNVTVVANRVKSIIASVPTSHSTVFYITEIRRVQSVPVGPAGVAAAAATTLAEAIVPTPAAALSYYSGGGGGAGSSAQLDRIIALLVQIASQDQRIVMDGKEVGRLVRRHIFENVGAYT